MKRSTPHAFLMVKCDVIYQNKVNLTFLHIFEQKSGNFLITMSVCPQSVVKNKIGSNWKMERVKNEILFEQMKMELMESGTYENRTRGK